MNYETEAENIEKGGDWVKLGVGVHKLIPLEEIPDPVKSKQVIRGVEKEVEQSTVLVDFQGSRKKWGLTKGTTGKSLWGQLMILGRHYKSLVGKPLTIVVKVSKDKNNEDRTEYAVLECVELLQKQQKLL